MKVSKKKIANSVIIILFFVNNSRREACLYFRATKMSWRWKRVRIAKARGDFLFGQFFCRASFCGVT
jgi:hypothetical protein